RRARYARPRAAARPCRARRRRRPAATRHPRSAAACRLPAARTPPALLLSGSAARRRWRFAAVRAETTRLRHRATEETELLVAFWRAWLESKGKVAEGPFV